MYAYIRKALFIVPVLLLFGVTGYAEVPQKTVDHNDQEVITASVYFRSGGGYGQHRWHRGGRGFYGHPSYYYRGNPRSYYYRRHYPQYRHRGGVHFRFR